MQHLDEGTVHAWLDGELSEIESAAAARHVAACPQCAALVAEVRGVIAGAARIVTALDAGPVGAIPKSPRSNAPKAAGVWRRFASSPSRMAMAATILVAVGVALTVRRAGHESQAKPGAVDEARAVLSAPIAPASPATSASSAPPQAPSPTAELQDRAPLTARNKQAPAAVPKASGGNEAGFAARPIRQSAPASVGAAAVADNALADKKKDADARRDRPEVANSLSRPRSEGAASVPLRADSVRLSQELAKVSADSTAGRPAPPIPRQVEAASGSPMRAAAAAQPQNSRAAMLDAISEASLQGCYRLSGDTSAWRSLLPTSFMLAGPTARSQISAGGGQGAVSQKAASQSANAVERFSAKPNLAGYGVHVIGANGQADSTAIGDWITAGPTMARVRFANVDQGRLVTVLISTTSPVARVTVGDRTDSLRVTHVTCPR